MVNKTTFEQLSPEQQSALIDYRDWARPKNTKRDWKSYLLNDWARAGSDWPDASERYGWLQQLRNTYGPSWLAKLEVPE